MTVEHVIPRSHQPVLANVYANCLLACRMCNTARGDAANQGPHGAALLDPTTTPWGRHFTQGAGGRLEPRAGDPNATYTERLYRLNDPLKVAMRAGRAEMLGLARTVLQGRLDLVGRRLRRRANALRGSGKGREAHELEEEARVAEVAWRLACEVRDRARAVPSSAPKRCRCKGPRTLPGWLQRQLLPA